jgi:hypothetical protein
VAVDAQTLNLQLSQALNSRIVIEQAKGKISQAANIGMDRAFQRLRAHARNHNVRLSQLAAEIAAGTTHPDQLDPLKWPRRPYHRDPRTPTTAFPARRPSGDPRSGLRPIHRHAVACAMCPVETRNDCTARSQSRALLTAGTALWSKAWPMPGTTSRRRCAELQA